MRLLFLGLVLACLSACTTSAPRNPTGPAASEGVNSGASAERKNWFCHAISENNEARAHGEGHSASCEGTEKCAQEKALEACGRYHRDCVITFCSE